MFTCTVNVWITLCWICFHMPERCCPVCGSACSCHQEGLLLLWQLLQRRGAAGGEHALSPAGGSKFSPPWLWTLRVLREEHALHWQERWHEQGRQWESGPTQSHWDHSQVLSLLRHVYHRGTCCSCISLLTSAVTHWNAIITVAGRGMEWVQLLVTMEELPQHSPTLQCHIPTVSPPLNR